MNLPVVRLGQQISQQPHCLKRQGVFREDAVANDGEIVASWCALNHDCTLLIPWFALCALLRLQETT
nr:MAG TPA: hypothetical protein [Caudoviricetes sp.]